MKSIWIILITLLILWVLVFAYVRAGGYPIVVEGNKIIVTLEADDWVTVRDYGLIATVTVRRPLSDGSDCSWRERIGSGIEEIIIDRRSKI